MARHYAEILVIDVESTCWDGPPPQGQTSEMIEIGLCRLDLQRLELLDRHGLLIKPQRSAVSPFCTELTTITPEMLADGCSFAEACQRLRKDFGSRDRVWASYGDYDRRQFERQCHEEQIGFPFGPTHLNVKSLFALACGLHQEVGMAAALKRAGIPLIGTHHRGVDDAANIATLLAWLLQRFRGSEHL